MSDRRGWIGSRVLLHLLASFMAADHDGDVGRLDVAAGCEFVDDRIRLRE